MVVDRPIGLGRFRFARAEEAAAAVETALVAPGLCLLVAGVVSYGGYFWTAHTVQQLANDAARAAIAGLDDAERAALANAAVQSEAESLRLPRGRTRVEGARSDGNYTVRVAYDARDNVFWAFSGLVPMPEQEVTRDATIRLGGY